MNGGIYLFKKKILTLIPNRPCSLEDDILPNIIKKGMLTGKLYKDFFLDIGTPKYFTTSAKELKKWETCFIIKSHKNHPFSMLNHEPSATCRGGLDFRGPEGRKGPKRSENLILF